MAPTKGGGDGSRPGTRPDSRAGPSIKTANRSRWATRRLTVKSSSLRRLSLLARGQNQTSDEKKRTSGNSETLRPDESDAGLPDDANGAPSKSNARDADPRKLFFNIPLPDALKDESGNPAQTYARNKIRTAKYTPLSFVPKNLWLQFHNIANIFFLFLVILVIFPIFGGFDPGLNSAPLIVIIAITAIKDAIEDYRRSNLDDELNNAPVHRLVGWDNVNVQEDNVSLWRKTKKANTRFFGAIWRAVRSLWRKEAPQRRPTYDAEPRLSVETRNTPRASMAISPNSRQSFHSAQEEIQMTPVPSPIPQQSGQQRLEVPPDHPHQPSPFAPSAPSAPSGLNPARRQVVKGDLINHSAPQTGKPRFHRDAWKNLQVGDFVRIYNDDELPADIIILSTSDPDGSCYVETKNLDGETNLKVRSALRCGRSIKHARDCERAQFIIDSEAAQPNLYKYNGAVRWRQQQPGSPDGDLLDMSEPIGIDNLLLRGCNLRNTEWALGVVLFTGHDTKIMMNSGITPSKRPRIAREMNFTVLCNFAILFVMCLTSAIVSGVTWGRGDRSASLFDYGPIGGTPGLSGFITFWAALIVFQNLVPISLYISLEIVRTLQAIFIYSDVGMYYEKLDQPCIPKSWNISDDVGQIEYIFSDKTGTLTQNVMEFKKASVNGQPYGEAYTEAQAGMQKRLGIDVEAEGRRVRAEIANFKVRSIEGLRKIHDNPYLHDEDMTFIAPDFVEDLAGIHGAEQQRANEHFMLAIALCHTVIAERQPGDPPKMIFKAQSPDEAALVATARDMGFTVLSSDSDGIRLNVMGEERFYPILNTIEFNSNRKRMSSIIRMPDGRIVLFCKGADSVIYSRLIRGEQQGLRAATAEHLEMFAREGLRTLCIAEKVLDENEYYEWKKEHDVAATALEDREEKLEVVADQIEQNLWLLGGTAIEDRLQDGVPDTIGLLGDAGVKLWVLTGDKVETAINIGFSCNLLNNDMELVRLRVDEDESGVTPEEHYLAVIEKQLDDNLKIFNMTGSDAELKRARKDHEPPQPTHGLVVDGFTLRWVLDDTLKQKFLLLCKQCKSVLCCRVSPAQKAAVVSLVKNGLDVMTLSIGDGANDVAMIQEADVGVGIAGEEGRQAVMSSDYAIGQFRFLQRLVLVHGRWSYRRLAETISNFFYKNIVWTFAIFWYQIYCDFDITYVFEFTFIICFNLFFTSIPVILMGVLDQDVDDRVSLAVPQLYRRGIERLEWSQTKFWLYMVDGIYQSVMSYYIPHLTVYGANFVSKTGLEVADRLRLGCYIIHPAVITINLYILINTYRWDWLMLLVVILSDLIVFLITGIYTSLESSQVLIGAASQLYGELSFWLVLFLTPVVCVFPRFAIKAVQKVYFPYDVDIIREQITLGWFKPGTATQEVKLEEPLQGESSRSSELSAKKKKHVQYASVDEDRRPIYPPSVTTHNTRAHGGSDGSNYTYPNRASVDVPPNMPAETPAEAIAETNSDPSPDASVRPSIERARPSYDRIRASMDRVRPSYEATSDFTSAARLSRIESSHSAREHPNQQRRFNLTTVRKRGLSAFSKKSLDN